MHSSTRPGSWTFTRLPYVLPDFLSASLPVLLPCLHVRWLPLRLHFTLGSSLIKLSTERKLKHSPIICIHRHVYSYATFYIWSSVLSVLLLCMFQLLSHGAAGTWLLTDNDAIARDKRHLIWEITLKFEM